MKSPSLKVFVAIADALGRIVLPKDMRSHYKIAAGDALEITGTED